MDSWPGRMVVGVVVVVVGLACLTVIHSLSNVLGFYYRPGTIPGLRRRAKNDSIYWSRLMGKNFPRRVFAYCTTQ
jgi:hypothetical protein